MTAPSMPWHEGGWLLPRTGVLAPRSWLGAVVWPFPEHVSLRCRGAQLWQRWVPHGPGPGWTRLGHSGSWALVHRRELHFQKITLCLSCSYFLFSFLIF